MKFAKLALFATAIAATPFVANAQDAGTTIYSQVDDSVVGTVESNDGTTVVVDTGDYKAPLPGNYLAERPIGDTGKTGWTINATKPQIDAMMADQIAKQEAAAAEAKAKAEAEAAERLAAALVVGAPVITADEQSLGMVDEITEANVIVKTEDEQLVTLPQNLMWADEDGQLMARANLDDIMAALEAVGG
ncbi:hypothetical protein ACI5KX_12025 [Erythrobacter sp. GH1-10]|uniref:hypothetical protein n=1 Tax=Erythrobacter sp. GH1-10 TaxID=3349334 RepID=UPI0038781F65